MRDKNDSRQYLTRIFTDFEQMDEPPKVKEKSAEIHNRIKRIDLRLWE